MSRFTKKILYGIFYLAILAFIIYGVFVPSREPASEPSIASPRFLLRVTAVPQILVLENGRSIILAKIFNPNTDFGSPEFVYDFRLYNSSGKLLGEISGQDFIYPAETKCVFQMNSMVNPATVEKIETELSGVKWEKGDKFFRPAVAVQSVKTEVSSARIEVNGVVVNNGAFDLDKVRITAVVFDGYGFELFASQTEITGLSSLGRRSFSVIFPADAFLIEKISPDKTQVFVSAK